MIHAGLHLVGDPYGAPTGRGNRSFRCPKSPNDATKPTDHDLPGEVYGRGLGMCRTPPDSGAISGLSSYLTAAVGGYAHRGLLHEIPRPGAHISRPFPPGCYRAGRPIIGRLPERQRPQDLRMPAFRQTPLRTVCVRQEAGLRDDHAETRRAFVPDATPGWDAPTGVGRRDPRTSGPERMRLTGRSWFPAPGRNGDRDGDPRPGPRRPACRTGNGSRSRSAYAPGPGPGHARRIARSL